MPTRSISRSERLHRVSDSLWTIDGDPISFLTFPYQLRSTVARLKCGGLFVHSPVQLNAARDLVDSLGPVRYIVSPNKLHHLFLAEWIRVYSDAWLYAPPGLAARCPALPFHTELRDTPEAEWGEEIDQCIIRGSVFMEEVAFFHRASRSLILGDLVENHDPALFSWWQRAVARANRMLAPDGETPMDFRLTFWDRRSARASIQRMLAWRPATVIVAHGRCIDGDSIRFLEHALRWILRSPQPDRVILPPSRRR